MKHTKTHTYARARSTIAHWVIACVMATMIPGPTSMVPTAEAASSFRPTIFVNTEAFLIIDDDDTSSDVVMRFGDTLAKTLSFNRSLDRFEFNDDVYTSGGLTASGTIVTESGAYIDGDTFVVQAGSNHVGVGTATPEAKLHVVGSETRLDTGTSNGTTSLSFVDGGSEVAHILIDQTTSTFDIGAGGRILINSSDYINVSGQNYTSIQGSTTFIGNNVGIGTSAPKAALDVVGAISGSFVYATKSFSGAGLSDCDTAGTSKLLWDATTGRFSCGTDANTTYTAGQGLSLNGTSFRLNATVTGSVIQAANSLASSGTLVWEGAASGSTLTVSNGLTVHGNTTVGTDMTNDLTVFSNTSFMNSMTIGDDVTDSVTQNAGSWGFANSMNYTLGTGVNLSWESNALFIANNTNNYNIGVGTASPKSRLSVAGILSGVTLYATKSFSGAGLSDCDTAGTSKLLWDATTGRFSCGTDANTTYTAGQGLTLNGTSFSLTPSHSGTIIKATTTLASSGTLVWEGIGSGGKLFVKDFLSVGSKSSGSLLTVGRVGSGTRLTTMSNATLFSTDQMALGQLEGGAYFGRVGLKENQWGLSNFGTTWTTRESSRLWRGIAMSSDGTVQTAVVESDQIYISSDYGKTWKARESSRQWRDIAMSSDGKIQTAVVYGGQIYVSSDYGATWTARDSSRNWRSTAMSSDGKIQTAVIEGGGQIYVSSDYGATWTARNSSRDWQSVAMSSDGKIQTATVFGGQIYVSSDYGATWTAKETNQNWIGIAMSSDGKIQTAALYGGQIYVSNDYGATWTARESSRDWYAIAMSSDGKIQTAALYGGELYISHADSYQYGSVAIGTGSVKGNTKLMVQGILSGVTLYATKSFSGAGLSDCDTAGTSKLLWDATTGRFSCGTDANTTYTAGQGLSLAGTSFKVNSTLTGSLARFLTVSGSTVFAKDTLASSGSIILKSATGNADMFVTSTVAHANGYFDAATSNNAAVRLRENSSTKWSLIAQGTTDNFIIAGDGGMAVDDFVTITQNGNVGIGPGSTMAPKAKLDVVGAISGSFIYATRSFSGAGLSDCDNATNSKLLWDATTGRFSCGTDQSGAGGLSLSDADARYVNVAGDTMTGVLAVQNGNTHTATTTPLLNIRGTMSGRSLTISGSGASPLLSTTTDKPTVRIGGSGSLVIEARSTDPGSAPANTASLFAQKVGGRTMLHQGSGSTFGASPLQNALFGNLIMSITTGAGTTVNGYGTTVTNDTTVSHPAAGETFGYMTNFATSTTANDEAGTSSANTAFFRGSAAGANGFFYYARIGVVDTTSITVFSGMADQTIATMVGADNPAGNHVGFQFSTGRGDTNWMFTTKDNTTQNANSTGLAFTANKVYDLMFTCTKQCASITWEIRNVTDGTSAKGTTSTNLPAAGTAMRMVLGVETETTAARNIRMQQLYVEVDR